MRVITVILFVLNYSICSLGLANESHCTSDEMTIFNCHIGKKIVSVCAKGNFKSLGYLQYRYGPNNSPELVLPKSKIFSLTNIKANTLSFSGGGGAYIRFQKDRYSYVVYTAIGKGWGQKAGIAVEKNNKLQINLPCKDKEISELGPDFFDQAGLERDQMGFELP